MDKLRKLLAFLRITDDTGAVSLTNLCVFAAVGAAAFAPVLAATHIGALALALANYVAKRVIDVQAAKAAATLVHADAVKSLQGRVDAAEATAAAAQRDVSSLKSALNLKQALTK